MAEIMIQATRGKEVFLVLTTLTILAFIKNREFERRAYLGLW